MNKNETKGWICPKCGHVYAPWIDKCQYCGSSTITYTPPTCPYQWWWNSPIYTSTTTQEVTLNTNGTSSATTANSTLTNEVKC